MDVRRERGREVRPDDGVCELATHLANIRLTDGDRGDRSSRRSHRNRADLRPRHYCRKHLSTWAVTQAEGVVFVTGNERGEKERAECREACDTHQLLRNRFCVAGITRGTEPPQESGRTEVCIVARSDVRSGRRCRSIPLIAQWTSPTSRARSRGGHSWQCPFCSLRGCSPVSPPAFTR